MTREYTVIFEDSNSIDIKEVKTIFLPSILSSILIFFSKVITLKIWCVFLFSICLEIIHIHLFKIKIASDYTVGEGNGNPLQYSCLENPMDGGAW